MNELRLESSRQMKKWNTDNSPKECEMWIKKFSESTTAVLDRIIDYIQISTYHISYITLMFSEMYHLRHLALPVHSDVQQIFSWRKEKRAYTMILGIQAREEQTLGTLEDFT